MQYIQNTINKAEIEKIENNHKGIDAERRRKTVIDMPEDVCTYGYHIRKVGTFLISRPISREVVWINACLK